ncbi:MAG: hypothetical protein ACK4S4_15565 [Pyrinomonadaceae bacterium]
MTDTNLFTTHDLERLRDVAYGAASMVPDDHRVDTWIQLQGVADIHITRDNPDDDIIGPIVATAYPVFADDEGYWHTDTGRWCDLGEFPFGRTVR